MQKLSRPKIFLSYSTNDKLFVKRLVADLEKRDIQVWVDFGKIKPGDSIIEKISKAIKKNDFLGIILSCDSVKSKWVKKELAIAVTLSMKRKFSIIPILLEECHIPPSISDLRYADFTKGYKTGLKDLLQVLGQEKKLEQLVSSEEADTERYWKMFKGEHESKGSLQQTGKEILEREKPRRKILIIGGGEIGTEIGIAARAQKWDVRSVIGEKPSPIMYLPFYTEDNNTGFRVIDFETTGAKANPHAFFQYLSLPRLRNNDDQQMRDILNDLSKFIAIEKPDVVLLEDVFLTPQEWKDLVSKTVQHGGLGSKKPYFIPSATRTLGKLESEGNCYSDIFLSKIAMKKFLCGVGLKDHVIGSEYQEEDPNDGLEIDIVDLLEKELTSGKFGKQWHKIENALKHYRKIILKPACTSSGHGQFTLSRMSRLTVAFVKKQLDILAEYRVPNRMYIIEPYLREKVETCVVKAISGKNESLCLIGIYYDKINVAELKRSARARSFKGQMILLNSRTPVKQNIPEGLSPLFISRIPEIIDKISANLSVPFIYVEFFIHNTKTQQGKTSQIYINEISHRPDDAGFITLISHERDQFELFVTSLELFLDDETQERHNSISSEPLEPAHDWVCKTLMLCEKGIKLDNSRMKYKSVLGPVDDHFQFKLYVKPLSGKRYVRIIGYQWHHKTQEDRDEGKHILEMHREDLGLSTDELNQLMDFQEIVRKKTTPH